MEHQPRNHFRIENSEKEGERETKERRKARWGKIKMAEKQR
jgi:hypothetical protein